MWGQLSFPQSQSLFQYYVLALMSAVPHDIAVVSTHWLSANPFHWVGEEKLREKSRRGAMLFLLNNAWASGTVLRPFLQPERPLSSRNLVSGFKCKLRDSNSRPPYSRPRALTTRLYIIHAGEQHINPVRKSQANLALRPRGNATLPLLTQSPAYSCCSSTC